MWYLYGWRIPIGTIGLGIYGAGAGIFVGAWAMALTEVIDTIPIFMRRIYCGNYRRFLAFLLAVAVCAGMLWTQDGVCQAAVEIDTGSPDPTSKPSVSESLDPTEEPSVSGSPSPTEKPVWLLPDVTYDAADFEAFAGRTKEEVEVEGGGGEMR